MPIQDRAGKKKIACFVILSTSENGAGFLLVQHKHQISISYFWEKVICDMTVSFIENKYL